MTAALFWRAAERSSGFVESVTSLPVGNEIVHSATGSPAEEERAAMK